MQIGTTLGIMRRSNRFRSYLLRDRFAVDQAAPLPGTRVAAPGSLSIVDSESKLSIGGGRLLFASKALPAWSDPGFYGPALARVAGRTLLARVRLDLATKECVFTWNNSAAAPSYNTGEASLLFNNAGGLSDLAGIAASNVAFYAAATEYDVALVLRGAGAFAFIRGGAFADWTLLWVRRKGTAATLYPSWADASATGWIDDLRVADLPAPFNTDYGLATNRLVSPAAGAATTSTANAVIEWSFTFNGTLGRLAVRRTDANNRWLINAQGDGKLQLVEHNAGVATIRITADSIFASGTAYRVVLVQEGNVYRVYVNDTHRGSYTDPGSFNITQTAVSLDAVSGGTSEVICWPRTAALPRGI